MVKLQRIVGEPSRLTYNRRQPERQAFAPGLARWPRFPAGKLPPPTEPTYDGLDRKLSGVWALARGWRQRPHSERCSRLHVMNRAFIVFFIVIDIALICLIVQALSAHRRQPAESPRQYQDIVEEFEKKREEAGQYRGTGWGGVKGRIVWAGGALPERKPIDTSALKGEADACLNRFPLLSEDWVVNKANKGVRWSFVWLVQEPIFRTEKLAIHPDLQKVPEQEVVIDQPCYAFVPHAVALREGQSLVIKNSSAVLHHSTLNSKRARGSTEKMLPYPRQTKPMK